MRGIFPKAGPWLAEGVFILLFTGASMFMSSCKLFDGIGAACNNCKTQCNTVWNWIKNGCCKEVCEVNFDIDTSKLNPDDVVCMKSGVFLTDGGTSFLDERDSNGDLQLFDHTKTGSVWRRTLHLSRCLNENVNADQIIANTQLSFSACRTRNCTSPKSKLFVLVPNSRSAFKTNVDLSNCRATITFDASMSVATNLSNCINCCQ